MAQADSDVSNTHAIDHAPYRFITPQKWLITKLRIAVIGIGGTGSDVLNSLARLAYALRKIGHPGIEVVAFDGDLVTEFNVGRQSFYPADIGYNKSLVTVQRINYQYGLSWISKMDMFDLHCQNHLDVLGIDIVITCVDKAQFRADFAKYAKNRIISPETTLWIDTGNGSSTGQVIAGRTLHSDKDEIGLPSAFDLYPELDGMKDDQDVSCSMEQSLRKQGLPMNRAVSCVVIELLWQFMRNGGANWHGAFIDIENGTQIPIKIMKNQLLKG